MLLLQYYYYYSLLFFFLLSSSSFFFFSLLVVVGRIGNESDDVTLWNCGGVPLAYRAPRDLVQWATINGPLLQQPSLGHASVAP